MPHVVLHNLLIHIEKNLMSLLSHLCVTGTHCHEWTLNSLSRLPSNTYSLQHLISWVSQRSSQQLVGLVLALNSMALIDKPETFASC